MRARFSGRRALVTGGAGGIGRACAAALGREGAAVALLDQDGDALREAARELGVHAVAADVAEEAQVRTAVAEAARALGGPPDVLVAGAGIYRIAPALGLTGAAWDEVLAVNLGGCFFAAREVAAGLVEAGTGGAVVLISSIAGLRGDASEPSAHYTASKTALVGLARQLAAEWAPHGIRVNAVCPGVIDTPMLRLTDDPAAAEDYLATRVPLGRLGAAAEVADAVCFLASDESSYITGAALPVDGGVTAI